MRSSTQFFAWMGWDQSQADCQVIRAPCCGCSLWGALSTLHQPSVIGIHTRFCLVFKVDGLFNSSPLPGSENCQYVSSECRIISETRACSYKQLEAKHIPLVHSFLLELQGLKLDWIVPLWKIWYSITSPSLWDLPSTSLTAWLQFEVILRVSGRANTCIRRGILYQIYFDALFPEFELSSKAFGGDVVPSVHMVSVGITEVQCYDEVAGVNARFG